MGFLCRGVALAALFALLAPKVALAQAAGSAAPLPASPAASSGAGPGGGAGPGATGADEKKAASTGNVGGASFTDKPARRTPSARATRRTGPFAAFPGFEQLPDGGSRLFVQLSQPVPVEERRVAGSVTYVLKGAHLRVHNDANALVTVHFNTPVFRARLTPQGDDLLFVLELRSAATPAFKVSANPDKTASLQIDFPKGDFLRGDGTETVPNEGKGRALGTIPKGVRSAPSAPPPPARDDDNGPNP